MANPDKDTTPWYKQFYPWMLIFFPVLAIVGCTITIVLAFTANDSVVSDNYYKDGLAINRRLEQDHEAQDLGIAAELRFDLEVGDILLDITGLEKDPEQLQLEIIHPTSNVYDVKVTLHQLQGNRYRGDLDSSLSFRQYLRLSPVGDINDVAWRLNGEVNFKESQTAKLGGQ